MCGIVGPPAGAIGVMQGDVEPYVSYRIEPDPDGTRFTMTGGIDQLRVGERLLAMFARPALRRETLPT